MTSLLDIANAASRRFTATLSREEQRAMGQFMTPPPIARFMAQRLVAGINPHHIRVFEPTAGGESSLRPRSRLCSQSQSKTVLVSSNCFCTNWTRDSSRRCCCCAKR